MHVDRIQKSIETLKKVHENKKKFDMRSWCSGWSFPNDCNTAACAFGWIARSKWAKELGLELNSLPQYEGEFGYAACVKFYDIEPGIAISLFAEQSYPRNKEVTPLDVVRRLEVLLTNE